MDWRLVGAPLSLHAARKLSPLPSLQGHAKLPEATFERLARKMVASDPVARNTLRRWQNGKGLPRTDEVPIRDLVLSALYEDEHEKHLYAPIKTWHTDAGWVSLTDDVRAAIRNLRGSLAFDPDGGDHGLRPDIVLRRPRAKRLVVIEVKRLALPVEGLSEPG